MKEQLTRRAAASEQRRLQQLFSAEERLGDRTPSHACSNFLETVNNTDGAFRRDLFLQRLPSNVRLAQLAHKIMEVATPACAVSSVNTDTEFGQLRQEV